MSQITAPLVSIVIPVYNAAPFVGATIQSIIAQTYQNLEIIAVDDGSTDRSVEVIKGFSDSRLRVIASSENLGPAGNWNRALRLAQGKYVKLICCDDLLAPECVARQVAILEDQANADVGLVGCATTIVNTVGKPMMVRGYPGGASGKFRGTDVIRSIVKWGRNPIGEPVSGLFRRQLGATVGEYRGEAAYAIDVDFWVRLLAVSDLYIINEPLCSFRISTTSWSASLGLNQFRDIVRFLRSTATEHAGLIRSFDLMSGIAMAAVRTIARVAVFKLFA